jgi:hypothetical protein
VRLGGNTLNEIASTAITSDVDLMKIAARDFYRGLYTKNPVEADNTLCYLSDIAFDRTLGDRDAFRLSMLTIITDFLIQESHQSIKASSSGYFTI